MKRMVLVLAAALLLAPALAWAGFELNSKAEVEVVKKGTQGEQVVSLVDADKANVVPGDTVVFTIGYCNNSDQPATDVVFSNPIPQHMAYVDGSAAGKGTRVDVSIDHGKTFGPLEGLKVVNAAGKERPANAADVTEVRWILEQPVPPGGKGTVSYRARVK